MDEAFGDGQGVFAVALGLPSPLGVVLGDSWGDVLTIGRADTLRSVPAACGDAAARRTRATRRLV
jgi:hypothetical protein